MSGNSTNDCAEECQLSTREKYEKWFSGVVKQDDELEKSSAIDPDEMDEEDPDKTDEEDPDKTDEEDPDKTDEEDPDKTDEEELSEQDTAVIRQYEPNTEEGDLSLDLIRAYFKMDGSTPFANVRSFLERNDNVIRHLHSETVPNPDHYVTGDGYALHEPVRTASRARTARIILYYIRSVLWESETIDLALRMVTNPHDPNDPDDIVCAELRRKHRHRHLTRLTVQLLRERDPVWREEYDALTAKRAQERAERRRSSLRKEVRFDDAADKRGADDAGVSNATKRLRS